MLLSVIIGLMIFIIGVLMLNFVPDEASRLRTNLDCSNTSISDGTKLTCLTAEVANPYFIILIVSAAGGIIFGRLL